MSTHIYRYQVLRLLASNEIFEAHDPVLEQTVKIYRWTPTPDSLPSSLTDVDGCLPRVQELGVEVFSEAGSMCLVASNDGAARAAFDLLRAHSLFPGYWPGMTSEPEPPPPVSTEDRKSEPPSSVWTTELRWIVGIFLFAFIAILAFAISGDREHRNREILAERRMEELKRQEEDNRAALLRKQFEGLWRESGEFDGTYSDTKERFHAQFSGTLQVSLAGDRFRGVWAETNVFRNVATPGGFTRYRQGTFILQLSGNQATGDAESARKRDSRDAWTPLKGSSFSGSLSDSGLQYQIVWSKDQHGAEIESSSGTLRR